MTGTLIMFFFSFFPIVQENSGISGFAKAATQHNRREDFKGCFSAFSLLPLTTSLGALQLAPFFGCEAAASVAFSSRSENRVEGEEERSRQMLGKPFGIGKERWSHCHMEI